MSQNLHLFIIAAITWATYQSKIIEQNGTFESTSRQRLVCNVLHHVMQRDECSAAGYGGWLTPAVPTLAALSARRIAFMPQRDHARVHR